jgi:hypothetical protein
LQFTAVKPGSVLVTDVDDDTGARPEVDSCHDVAAFRAPPITNGRLGRTRSRVTGRYRGRKRWPLGTDSNRKLGVFHENALAGSADQLGCARVLENLCAARTPRSATVVRFWRARGNRTRRRLPIRVGRVTGRRHHVMCPTCRAPHGGAWERVLVNLSAARQTAHRSIVETWRHPVSVDRTARARRPP